MSKSFKNSNSPGYWNTLLFFSLTNKCSSTCTECKMVSKGVEYSECLSDADIISFLNTITSDNSPEALILTKSEPLLRPGLILKIKEILKPLSTKLILETHLCQHVYFTAEVMEALDAADYIGINIDRYITGNFYVSPDNLINTINRIILGLNKTVYIHTNSDLNNSNYLHLQKNIESKCPDRVQYIDSLAHLKGTAAGGAQKDESRRPCNIALSTFITSEGNILGCSNFFASTILPKHLLVGTIYTLKWQDLLNHLSINPLLRILRVYGPETVTSAQKNCPCRSCLHINKIEDSTSIEFTELANTKEFKVMETYLQSKMNSWISWLLIVNNAET